MQVEYTTFRRPVVVHGLCIYAKSRAYKSVGAGAAEKELAAAVEQGNSVAVSAHSNTMMRNEAGIAPLACRAGVSAETAQPSHWEGPMCPRNLQLELLQRHQSSAFISKPKGILLRVLPSQGNVHGQQVCLPLVCHECCMALPGKLACVRGYA